ncbi:ribosome maturation factor RimM [Comamonas aquatilis]|uniref:ribosome maturation factor RimM n=1 Tax=Comamonas aquatilis TaxID=1778406 RepID=UPI0039F0D91D
MSHMPALEATTLPADAVEVGRIADAWGIKGWFKVMAFSSDPEALFAAKEWFLLPAEKGAKQFTGTVLLPVKQARVHSDTIVATSPVVEDRNTAEALRGARVFVAREHFPKTDDGEYYWVDLLGLSVVNREGVALGVVRDLLSTGPQTVLILGYEQDGKEQERLIPFVDAYVDSVDLPGKTIVADWQADY